MQLNENLDFAVLLRLNGDQLAQLDTFARSDASPRTQILRRAIKAGLVVMNAEREAYQAYRDAQRRFDRLVLGEV